MIKSKKLFITSARGLVVWNVLTTRSVCIKYCQCDKDYLSSSSRSDRAVLNEPGYLTQVDKIQERYDLQPQYLLIAQYCHSTDCLLSAPIYISDAFQL